MCCGVRQSWGGVPPGAEAPGIPPTEPTRPQATATPIYQTRAIPALTYCRYVGCALCLVPSTSAQVSGSTPGDHPRVALPTDLLQSISQTWRPKVVFLLGQGWSCRIFFLTVPMFWRCGRKMADRGQVSSRFEAIHLTLASESPRPRLLLQNEVVPCLAPDDLFVKLVLQPVDNLRGPALDQGEAGVPDAVTLE